jgi:hypothetical protein
MEEANKLCKPLAEVYYKCMDDTKRGVMRGDFDNKCEESFEDYSLCIREAMRQKVERLRAKR